MDKVTRRRFVTLSGVTAAGALAYGATTVSWSQLLGAAQQNPLQPGTGVLVVVTLYGGNDGLNTVIPASDHVYQDARPALAYQPGQVLDLGDGLGLNPGMKGMKKLWDERRLGIVRGVGYPQPDHSHFRSMAIWQTGSPKTQTSTGWLGRWLDATGDDPLRAVSVEPLVPPLLAGETTAGASLPASGLQLPTGALGQAFRALATAQPGEPAPQARAAKSVADLLRTAQSLGGVVRPSTTAGTGQPPVGQRGKAAAAGGRGALGTQLDLVAGLVEAGVPTRAYSVSLGGFDTHADERGTQERLLTELDSALSPFVERVRGSDRGKHVVVIVYSEFGRRVRANASHGTDHGTAGPLFVLGERVRGGFYGAQPSLTDLDNGDLKATSDFRDVYGTVLEQVLGADAGRVLGGHKGRVSGLLSA